MAATTLGALLNQGLLAIREPEITALTSGNILQDLLIDDLNMAVDELANEYEFDWALRRGTLTFTAVQESGTVDVTNGSATVTGSAEIFGSVAAGMYFVRKGDNDAYRIDSVDTGASPDTITLEDDYVGDTGSAVDYFIVKMEYSITDTNFDDFRVISYPDSSAQVPIIGGGKDSTIRNVKMSDIMRFSDGNPYRDQSGRPRWCTRIGVDSSNNPVYLFVPAPRYAHRLEYWFQPNFSESSAFADAIFGSDAPQLAYTALGHRMRAAATHYDKQPEESKKHEAKYRHCVGLLLRRENDEAIDRSMRVLTYRNQAIGAYPARSGQWFDHRGAQR